MRVTKPQLYKPNNLLQTPSDGNFVRKMKNSLAENSFAEKLRKSEKSVQLKNFSLFGLSTGAGNNSKVKQNKNIFAKKTLSRRQFSRSMIVKTYFWFLSEYTPVD